MTTAGERKRGHKMTCIAGRNDRAIFLEANRFLLIFLSLCTEPLDVMRNIFHSSDVSVLFSQQQRKFSFRLTGRKNRRTAGENSWCLHVFVESCVHTQIGNMLLLTYSGFLLELLSRSSQDLKSALMTRTLRGT